MAYQILLVDDDAPTRFVYREILSRVDFEVFEAADGVKAVDYLSHNAPHLIILDLRLPRKSGIEVLEYVYTSPHLADTHVIIFSAHERMLNLDLRPGDEFLLKPLSPKLLREAAQRAVNSSSVAS